MVAVSALVVTTATSQRSKARPSRSSRRARSPNTAGVRRPGAAARCASGCGPLQSPVSMRSPRIYTPSSAGHAHAQAARGQQVGNQATGGGLAVGAGHRHDRNTAIVAIGEHRRDDGLARRRGPCRTTGCRCMRRPGAALTSTMPPACSSNGLSMVPHTASTPQMSRSTIWAAATARAAMSGWTSSVTSVALPPVDKLALLRKYHRACRWPAPSRRSDAAWPAWPARCRRSGSWSATWHGPRPGAGRGFTSSTSWRTVCTPSPITCGGSRRAAATRCLPTTSRRKSWPGM